VPDELRSGSIVIQHAAGPMTDEQSPPTTADSAGQSSRLGRLLPIIDWGRRYERAWLRADLVAGLAVAALVVPKSLG
jgi:hypothetical protein